MSERKINDINNLLNAEKSLYLHSTLLYSAIKVNHILTLIQKAKEVYSMNQDSLILSLLEDGFSEEEAEMITEDLIAQFGDDPDFQD